MIVMVILEGSGEFEGGCDGWVESGDGGGDD